MRDSHYLTCQDENCERAPCVDRREWQWKEKRLRARITALEADLPARFHTHCDHGVELGRPCAACLSP